MSSSHARGRPSLLPALVVVVGAVLAILIAPAAAPNNSDPSSYATGRAGTWALYHLLASVGAAPARLTGGGFRAALHSDETLVEAAPTIGFTSYQIKGMVRFVRGGGTLLYALGTPTVDGPVLTALGLSQTATVPGGSWRESLPLGGQPRLLVQTGPASGLGSAGATTLPLLGPAQDPVALLEQLGRGRAIVLGSESPISNGGLRQGQNALFTVLAAAASTGHKVVFDEIHHGYSLGDGAAALLMGTPLGLATLLVAGVGLLFLASSGRRLGRPLPPPELVAVRTTEEQLDALAQLYSRTRDRRAVAGHYLEELRARAGPELVRSSAAGSSATERRLTALLAQLAAASTKGVERTRLTELVRSADRLERELAGAVPSPPQSEVPEK
ncbi:MAG: DUF4350 domain-containing protein [Candidatus Dormibacteria bacterium]